jgi:hypothetical protein
LQVAYFQQRNHFFAVEEQQPLTEWHGAGGLDLLPSGLAAEFDNVSGMSPR